MNSFLTVIGLLSICMVILYIMKKVSEYLDLKKEEKTSYKFDKDDDE